MTHEERARADAALSDEAFRVEVRGWIEANYMLERNLLERPKFAAAKPWYVKLNERGWLAPAWPIEYGGSALPIRKQVILVEEQERFGTCRLNDMGVTMIGPLLIAYGTPEQKAALLPGILNGDIAWCQGYSEPGAGSDLASLRSQALREGDFWRINGRKIWTTRANDSNWMFALLRTDTTGAKQDGISMFVFPMDTPGITVRSIRDLNGGTELCETFLDDVIVGRDALIGQVNKGWSISRALLGFERLYVGSPKQSAHAIVRLHDLIGRLGRWNDAVIVDTYVQLLFDLENHIDLYESMIDQVAQTGIYPPDISLLKISQSELYQRITDQLLELGGALAGLVEPLPDSNGLSPANQFLFARPITIYGGSSEIQRNIIARRVLGLPG